MSDSQYGQIITATRVRHAVRDTLKLWMPSYLAEIARQEERQGIPPAFKSFHTSPSNFLTWPGKQLPACIIVIPGIDRSSIERQANRYSAVWPIGVGALIASTDTEQVMTLAELYAAAMRSIFGQHGSLGGFAVETEWLDEDYDELPSSRSRSHAGATVNIRVRVSAVLDSAAGLAAPPDDPTADPGEPPVVVSTGVDISATPPFSKQEIDL